MLYEMLDKMKYSSKIGVEALIIVVLVFALTCLMGKLIIPRLRAKKLNQPISGYVSEHSSKSGTPTMGGICFILASLIFVLVWIIANLSQYFYVPLNLPLRDTVQLNHLLN